MADSWVRPTSPGPPDSGVPSRPKTKQSLHWNEPRDPTIICSSTVCAKTRRRTDGPEQHPFRSHARSALFHRRNRSRPRSLESGRGDLPGPLGRHGAAARRQARVDAGVSGECLRSGRSQRCNDSLTDPRVNAEVCKEMESAHWPLCLCAARRSHRHS